MLCFYLYLYFYHIIMKNLIEILKLIRMIFCFRALTTMDSDEVCMKSIQKISLRISFIQFNDLNQELITFLWLVMFCVTVSVGSNYILNVALCICQIMAFFYSKNYHLLLHSDLVILVES
jgi:hypothetical protein